MSINWNEFAKEVHRNAVDKGWWDKSVTIDDVVCGCICELAEAVEEYRSGRPILYYPCNAGGVCERDKADGMDCGSRVVDNDHPEIYCKAQSKKPCGVAVELADCVLRLLDYLATTDADLDAEMGWVPSADTIPGLVCECAHRLAKAHINTTALGGCYGGVIANLVMCIDVIRDWFNQNNIDLESILREKHEYNKTRPYRHGGKKL